MRKTSHLNVEELLHQIPIEVVACFIGSGKPLDDGFLL